MFTYTFPVRYKAVYYWSNHDTEGIEHSFVLTLIMVVKKKNSTMQAKNGCVWVCSTMQAECGCVWVPWFNSSSFLFPFLTLLATLHLLKNFKGL